jgi:hypothetical protein
MTEKLDLTCSISTPYLPSTEQPRLVYLLLEVNGPVHKETLPVNLSFVVDTSDSMHIRLVTDDQFEALAKRGLLKETLIDGVPAWQPDAIPSETLTQFPRKIDRVKDALRTAVEQLRAQDRFSLIAFAQEATCLIPSTPGSKKRQLLESIGEIDNLRLGDKTYIAKGIALGFDELQRNQSPKMVDRLLILTDGFAFDEAECRAWAQRARQHHLPISTMGLGGDFNEELMIPIADQTGGEAYLLAKAEDTPAAFSQELQRAQAVHYRDLEVKLRASQGVEIRAAYQMRPSITPLEVDNQRGSYSFPLGDLVAQEEPALLLELIVPPRSPGAYRLTKVVLTYNDPSDPLGVKVRKNVVTHYTTELAPTMQKTPRVMHLVEALSAYKLQQGAKKDLKTGDIAGATRKLRAAATRLLDMGEGSLATEMELQATALEHHGKADPDRKKRLRYETRKLTQKLKS